MPQSVFDQKGNVVSLGEKIGSGGEGTVWRIINAPADCAKLYDPKKLTLEHREKVMAMVRNAPDDPTWRTQHHRSIAWPQGALFEDAKRSRFCGFSMPLLDISRFYESQHFFTAASREKQFGSAITWKHLLTSACNLSSAVAAIHAKQHCVGDLRETNILVAPNALVTLIDCDSFQILDAKTGKRFFTRVGTDGYLPPELIGTRINFASDDHDRYHSDLFALAVVIFRLLMNGNRPYAASGALVNNAPSMSEKIKKGHFAYSGRISGLRPPLDAPAFDLVPPSLQQAFERCFIDGHGDKHLRPTARQWLQLLARECAAIAECQKSPSHFYASHLRRCPWCERAAVGNDPFPGAALLGQQVAVSEPAGSDSLEDRMKFLKSHLAATLADGMFTAGERQYIVDLGLRLRIPMKQIESVIKKEISSSGAKTANMTASVGTPMLSISEDTFGVYELVPNSSRTHSFGLSNEGGGTLQGTISASKKWVRLSQTAIDPSRHRQVVDFVLDASGFEQGHRDSGWINIASNGGNQRIRVDLRVRISEQAMARFYWLAVIVGGGLGALMGGALCSVLVRTARMDYLVGILRTSCLAGAIGGAFVSSFASRSRWKILIGLTLTVPAIFISCAGFSTIEWITERFTQPGFRFAMLLTGVLGAWMFLTAAHGGLIKYSHRHRVKVLGLLTGLAYAALLTIPSIGEWASESSPKPVQAAAPKAGIRVDGSQAQPRAEPLTSSVSSVSVSSKPLNSSDQAILPIDPPPAVHPAGIDGTSREHQHDRDSGSIPTAGASNLPNVGKGEMSGHADDLPGQATLIPEHIAAPPQKQGPAAAMGDRKETSNHPSTVPSTVVMTNPPPAFSIPIHFEVSKGCRVVVTSGTLEFSRELQPGKGSFNLDGPLAERIRDGLPVNIEVHARLLTLGGFTKRPIFEKEFHEKYSAGSSIELKQSNGEAIQSDDPRVATRTKDGTWVFHIVP